MTLHEIGRLGGQGLMVKLPRLSDVTGRVNCSTEMAKEEEGEEPRGTGREGEGGADKVQLKKKKKQNRRAASPPVVQGRPCQLENNR